MPQCCSASYFVAWQVASKDSEIAIKIKENALRATCQDRGKSLRVATPRTLERWQGISVFSNP
jgi:hypothetical protein